MLESLEGDFKSLHSEAPSPETDLTGKELIIISVCVQLCPTLCTPWTVAHQAPLAMGFSKQEYWRGLSFPPPGDLPDPGIEPTSLMSPSPVFTGRFFSISATW